MRTFTILEFAGKNWAVDLSHLREVIEQIPSTPVPLAPASIRGVINLRGDLVPVLALDAWLDLQTSDSALARRRWMAVLDVGRYYFGVLADRVNTVTFEGELDAPPPGMSNAIEGTAETAIGTIHALRIHSLLRKIEQGLTHTHLLAA